MEVEALRDKITATLCQLSRDQLIEVGYNVKGFATPLDEPTKDTSRCHLMKVIEHKLDEVENSYTQDDAVQFVKELLSFLGEYKAKDNAAESDFFRPSDERDKYDELQEEIKAIGQKLKMADAAPSLGQNLPSSKVPEVTIRREFRICGQIGEGGQRDRLSYTNLLHQMENGLSKGHSESEVIEAVIRAINPGLKLRDMLEIKTDLTLTQL